MLCRAESCGCEVTNGAYCEMCRDFTPICPECGAVYGEHRLDCTVADGYDDCREGPWQTEAEAESFARAEVGVPWQIAKGTRGFYVMTKEEN